MQAHDTVIVRRAHIPHRQADTVCCDTDAPSMKPSHGLSTPEPEDPTVCWQASDTCHPKVTTASRPIASRSQSASDKSHSHEDNHRGIRPSIDDHTPEGTHTSSTTDDKHASNSTSESPAQHHHTASSP